MKKSYGNIVFDILNYSFLVVFALTTFYPLWHVVSLSMSSYTEALRGGMFLFPREFTMDAYASIIKGGYIFKPYINTTTVTVAGTFLSLMLTSMGAYAVTKDGLPGKKTIIFMVLFTMLFSGGMIPTYMVVKSLGLVNSLWALIIQGAVPAFNLFIMKSFFEALPKELEESAYIEGANPISIFFRIILPLSKPVIATIALWVAVGHWNDFMNAVIYISDNSKNTLALFLKNIIKGQEQLRGSGEMLESSTETFIAAAIIMSLLPILATYPYLQKYFVKGVMIGSIKG